MGYVYLRSTAPTVGLRYKDGYGAQAVAARQKEYNLFGYQTDCEVSHGQHGT